MSSYPASSAPAPTGATGREKRIVLWKEYGIYARKAYMEDDNRTGVEQLHAGAKRRRLRSKLSWLFSAKGMRISPTLFPTPPPPATSRWIVRCLVGSPTMRDKFAGRNPLPQTNTETPVHWGGMLQWTLRDLPAMVADPEGFISWKNYEARVEPRRHAVRMQILTGKSRIESYYDDSHKQQGEAEAFVWTERSPRHASDKWLTEVDVRRLFCYGNLLW
jgi:hypothetical protein